MVPNRLVELDELPQLPNGKVDRQRLRKLPLPAEKSAGTEGAQANEVPSTLEQGLLSLWEGLLGRFGLGLDDNFFEWGGHSLLVVEMTLAIERDFEVKLSSTDIFEHPTVRELARRIEQADTSAEPPKQHLLPIQPHGPKEPFLFAVPHFFTEMVATRFRGERPVYGLRGVSLRPEGNLGRWPTLRDLGEELANEVLRRFPGERYRVAGYSFGASMAVELVRVLEEQGIPVERLYLIAPMPLNLYRLGPFRLQIDSLREPVEQLSPGRALRLWARENHPLTRRPYARTRHHLWVRPWRRLLCAWGKVRTRLGLPLTSRILHADVRVERFRLHSRYDPKPIETPTVFFNAQETATDAAATWRPVFRGSFTLVNTPDPHLGPESAQAARETILDHWLEHWAHKAQADEKDG